MAAPDYVPTTTPAKQRHYVSPPRLADSWVANRPGDLSDHQPLGNGLGVPGPDQGYALALARRFEGKLLLSSSENSSDAVAGAVSVALKRAACFGRAPILADVELAFRLFGFLAPEPTEAFLAWRRELFAGLRHPHHYAHVRHLVDIVSAEMLRISPLEVESVCEAQRLQLMAQHPTTQHTTG